MLLVVANSSGNRKKPLYHSDSSVVETPCDPCKVSVTSIKKPEEEIIHRETSGHRIHRERCLMINLMIW